MLLKGQSFHQRLDEIKNREEAEMSRLRGEDFRERKREQKRAAIESKQQQRVERAERKLMMSFFDSPSQFRGPATPQPAPPAEAVAEAIVEESSVGDAAEEEPEPSKLELPGQLGSFNYRISNSLPAGSTKV